MFSKVSVYPSITYISLSLLHHPSVHPSQTGTYTRAEGRCNLSYLQIRYFESIFNSAKLLRAPFTVNILFPVHTRGGEPMGLAHLRILPSHSTPWRKLAPWQPPRSIQQYLWADSVCWRLRNQISERPNLRWGRWGMLAQCVWCFVYVCVCVVEFGSLVFVSRHRVKMFVFSTPHLSIFRAPKNVSV